MSTPSSYSDRHQLAYRAILGGFVVGFSMTGLLTGCSYSGGELLFALGMAKGPLVEAEFQLTDGPVLILIDDPAQRMDWPAASGYVFDSLSQELLRHRAARKIVPPETLHQLRQSLPDFASRGCREIGELAGAEQVIWIEIEDFLAEEQVADVGDAAYLAVTAKVINVKEKQSRSRVRVWPQSPRGKQVTVSMVGSEVALAKTKDAISKELAGRIALKLARFFYDHRLEDFERPE